jgi:hypothetical protein
MDRLDRVIVGLRYLASESGGWDEECTLNDVLKMTALVDACVCNIGVQECTVHPGRLFTTLERILFEKEWDRRVRESKDAHDPVRRDTLSPPVLHGERRSAG